MDSQSASDRVVEKQEVCDRRYKYTPLPGPRPYFRILRLDPGQKSEPLSGDLISAEIGPQTSNTYEAVSYRWCKEVAELQGGNQPHIRIGGGKESLQITRSLHGILNAIRPELAERWLWVDQICVNQCNDEEKASQVPLIGRIFSDASQTLIWLGDVSANASAAASLVEVYGRVRRELDKKCTPIPTSTDPGRARPRGRFKVPLSEQEYPVINIPPHFDMPQITSRNVQQIVEFFQNAWFTRTWIVQEVVVSQQIRVLVDKVDIDWEDVRFLANWFLQKFAHLDLGEGAIRGLLSARDLGIYAFRYKRRHKDIFSRTLCLTSLLAMIRPQEATDPRDKLYALLSMTDLELDSNGQPYSSTTNAHSQNISELLHGATAPAGKMESIPLRLRPDYTKPVEEVYHDLACYQMTKDKNISFLTFVQDPMEQEEELQDVHKRMPTWVPRWDVAQDTEPLWYPGELNMNFRASVTKETSMIFGLSSSADGLRSILETCTVQGVQVQTIQYAHSPATAERLGPIENTKWIHIKLWIDIEIEEHLRHQRKWPFRQKQIALDFIADLALALTAGRKESNMNQLKIVEDASAGKYAHIIPAQAFLYWFLDAIGHRGKHYKELLSVRRKEFWGAGLIPGSTHEVVQAFARRVHSACLNRTLFRTSDGRLGLGPRSLKKGDSVCILKSGQVPFILRKAPPGGPFPATSHQVVGPCYFRGNGAMVGNAEYNAQTSDEKLYILA